MCRRASCVKGILASLAAVGDVDIGPAVAIEIHDGHRCAHGRDLRHDVIQLVVERWALMNEVDAGRVGDFLEIKAMTGQRRFSIQLRVAGFRRADQRLNDQRAEHQTKENYMRE